MFEESISEQQEKYSDLQEGPEIYHYTFVTLYQIGTKQWASMINQLRSPFPTAKSKCVADINDLMNFITNFQT